MGFFDSQKGYTDKEISILVKDAEDQADNILSSNIDELHGIANALLEYESISGDEMKQIINGESIVRVELKPKTKRVRRRKKVSKEDSAVAENAPTIATKPAT